MRTLGLLLPAAVLALLLSLPLGAGAGCSSRGAAGRDAGDAGDAGQTGDAGVPDAGPARDAPADLEADPDGRSADAAPSDADGQASDAAPLACAEVEEGSACQDGSYYCCGDGAAYPGCCEGRAQGTCFPYGGVTGTCAGAGEIVDAHDLCSRCCQPLARGEYVAPGAAADGGVACLPQAPPGAFVCIQCGDGACGPGENACNCPEDCPPAP